MSSDASENHASHPDGVAPNVAALVALTSDEERHAYLQRNPQLCSDEGARVLCRTAVSLLSSDVSHSRLLCWVLDSISLRRPTNLTTAYREHAWGALLYFSGSDQEALGRWMAAISNFESAGREDEVAITCSCALQALAHTDQLELFWAWAERARLVFERNGDRLRLARLRTNIAHIYFRREDWQVAAKAYEVAYNELLHSGGSSRDIVATLTCLGSCQTNLGDLPRALHVYERARLIAEESALDSALAQLEENIAYLKYQQGDLGAALQTARRTNAYASLNGLTLFSHEAALTEAEVLRALCMTREAEERASEALAHFTGSGYRKGQGQAIAIMGLCASMRGRSKKAFELHAQSKRLFEAAGHLQSAHQAALNQAWTMLTMGDREAAATVTAELLRSLPPDPSNPLRLATLLLSSRISTEGGDPTVALQSAETALANLIFLDRTPLEAEALYALAKAHEGLGNVQLAYEASARSERSLARMRRSLALAELRASFLSDKTQLFQDLFALGLRLNLPPSQLLHHVENAKSLTLAEELDQRAPSLSVDGSESTEFAEAWGELCSSLGDLQEDRARVDPETRRRIDRLGRSAQAVERIVSAAKTNLAPIAPSQVPPNLDRLPSTLSEDTTLVEYYFARGDVFAFCITSAECKIVPLAAVPRVRRLHQLVRFQLRTRPKQERIASLVSLLQEAYELLWRPIHRYVDKPNVVIVPHGFLHQFPFHILHDGKAFLVDRHPISYSPSARAFEAMRNRRRETQTRGSIVIGSADLAAPGISCEARQVAALLPNARLFLNGDATKVQLLAELPRADLIHIAAHGFFSAANPKVSAVGLEDGPLTAGDIQDLRLNAELVVLSGCETGRIVAQGADEVMGLTRALLQAGVRSALVSLWALDDESTTQFMTSFYSRLKQGTDRANTLRQAQIEHRDTYGHPFFWAPFVLVGDPRAAD